MKLFKVRLTFATEILGSEPNDKEIYTNFIASKAPDAISTEEEIEMIGVDAVAEKGITVFYKKEDGTPCLRAHQIKGFFKSAAEKINKNKKSKYYLTAYKKKLDQGLFIFPTNIPLWLPEPLDYCQRSLRAQTAQGDRTALACSEAAPAGTKVEFGIKCDTDDIAKRIEAYLACGGDVGIGQWRGSGGKGRFEYKILEEKDIPEDDAIFTTTLKCEKNWPNL